MAPGKLAEIVIVVSGTHWQCVTCKLLSKRTVSLDQHLKLKHPYIPPLPPQVPVNAQRTLSDGEEYEEVQQTKSRGHRESKQDKTVSQVSQWLKQPDFDDSSDEVDDVVDNDDDSDFVPSESERKPTKASLRVSRKAFRKQAKKDIKRVRVQLPKKDEPVTEPDPVTETEAEPDAASEFEPPTEPEQTEPEDEEDEFQPKFKSGRGRRSTGGAVSLLKPRSRRGRRRSSDVASAETQVPRKRGRPPKPKPDVVEELPPKRPYRKKVPDPSELLLKLRNVGRKPNTRKKVATGERGGLKDRFIKFVSKGNPAVNVSEQGERVQVDDDDSNMVAEGQGEQNGSGLNISQDSMSSVDAATSATAQQGDDKQSREKVRCRTCLCLFSSDKLLKKHLNKVSGEDVLQCVVCEMSFHGLLDLNLHVFCDHEYEKQPFCFMCKEDFKSMEKLEKHLNKEHKGEPDHKLTETRFHDCRLCQMELNIDFQLIKNHYYRRHKAYVCPECYGKDVDLLFYTDTHLYAEHKQMHAKSPSECSICSQLFPTAREMKNHMWAHATDTTEDGTGGKCSKCDKWLPNSGAMLMHEKEHKNEAIRKNYALEASIGFPCMKCEHIFSSKSNLKKHACKADPNRTYYFHCEYCAHGCNTKEQLRDHIALHHLGIKRYGCDYCDQRFVCAPTLRRHVRRVHTKEKPYECHICKERFFERNLMLRHVSKHTGIASFMCEFCGKGFHTKFDLKKHVENHTETREFVCPNCGLDYKRSYHLKRHLEKGCKKRFFRDADDGNIPSVVSEAPLAVREDADEMVFMDIDDDDTGLGHEDESDDSDNYNDESSGPEYVDDGDDEMI
ncbi:uncharacterized protein [Littorina saxatilis]|uniref:uncharacterized protein n=1 Tax=Littorina saxatilis TaxID=31220 RepID=UPI0038B65025